MLFMCVCPSLCVMSHVCVSASRVVFVLSSWLVAAISLYYYFLCFGCYFCLWFVLFIFCCSFTIVLFTLSCSIFLVCLLFVSSFPVWFRYLFVYVVLYFSCLLFLVCLLLCMVCFNVSHVLFLLCIIVRSFLCCFVIAFFMCSFVFCYLSHVVCVLFF